MKYSPILMLLVLIVGCSSPIDAFEGNIHNVNQDIVQVDCTDAVNRDKEGDIPSIAYTCNVDFTEITVITDKNGKQINIDDLRKGQTVKVVLNEEVDISESNRDVTAAEIKVLN